MSEWRSTTWGEICALTYGKSIKGYQDRDTGYPVYGTNGPIGYWDVPLQDEPGLIIGRKGAYRGVHYAKGPFFVIDTAYALTADASVDIRWAYYSLLNVDINSMDSGSAIPSTSRDEFYGIPVLLPPLAEQREIASILGALDDKIELNRRMAATLEEMARALYRSWFVDFDPVKAKAEGLAPAFMDEATAALFPDRFGDDGLPEGWRRGALIDLSSLNPEKWGTRNAPDMVVYVDLSNTKWGVVEATTTYSWTEAPSRARMVLRPGDTIVGTVRPGNGSYAYIAEAGLTGSTGFAVLRPNRSNDAALVNLAATDADNIASLTNLADGGAYPAVRPEVVGSSEVVIAAETVRDAFAAEVTPIVNRIEEAKRESRSLAELRDALLPKLMSGEIRVGTIANQIEVVA